ncbi:GlcG/HbpS family heme-binding protein [Brevibacterium casei]|uniref:Heme-binding protein n=1 Tax=Brevibacterium casei TaxID=33889 RepID=A0A7T2WN53_9MICO|nr:heme-binding protein [Brevibacterium casei]QPS33565.1 heme-binding protein [Brevibacterium casei]
MTQLTLEDARRISDAALTAADQHGWLISVAIIDRHGNLVHFARQDGSTLASVVSSQSKAWTAAAVGVSTQDLQAAAQPGQAVYGLAHAGGPGRPMTAVPGAVPIRSADGDLVGAVGIGGAPAPSDDQLVAEAAAHWQSQ